MARVEEGAADERTAVRLNGRPAVGVGVIRQATANPLDLSEGVRDVIPKLKADLPPDVLIDIANDNSVFIDRSVKNVYRTIFEAVLLVALVIFVFLRTLRASIIPIITIPVSLIGTFALMALAGFTINTLTLLALVLAIGLVVDDAIVMLENIFRHIEEGMDPFSAGIKGAREIGFAIITMTATLVAVYAPLAFTPGRTGRLFVEFALALAGAVVVSGFVALTLTPMLCTAAAQAQPQAEPLRPHHGARADEHFGALRRAAALDRHGALSAAGARPPHRPADQGLCAPGALDRGGRDAGQRRGHCAGVPDHEAGTLADGRPGRDPGQRQCAGRLDARLHQPLRPGAGKDGPAVQGIRPHLCQRRQPDGGAGQRGLPHGGLGGPQPFDHGHGARAAAQVQCAARRDGLFDHAAFAGPGLSRAAAEFRHPDLGQLPEPQRRGAPDA